jgi:hypothetical protein
MRAEDARQSFTRLIKVAALEQDMRPQQAASFTTGTDIGEDNGYTAMGPDQVAAAIPLLMP